MTVRRLRIATGLALATLVLSSCAAPKRPEVVGVEYETRVSGAGVVDSDPGMPGSPGTAAATGGPASTSPAAQVASGPPPSFVEEDRMRVVEVVRSGNADGTRLVVQLSRTPDSWNALELDKPRRCVVDVTAATSDRTGPSSIHTGDSLAPTLRVGGHPGRIRLVAEASASSGSCQTTAEGSAIVIGLGAAPSGAPTTTVWESSDMPTGAAAHAAFVLAEASGSPVPAETAVADLEPGLTAEDLEAHAPPIDDPKPGEPLALAAPPASPEAAKAPPPPPSSPAHAATTDDLSDSSVQVKRYNGRRISLEFKDADILNVLRIIADVAHRNIVATDDVTGRVTLVLYDVPWDQALDILLRSTGLEKVEYDDVITVSTSKRIEEERRARLAAQQAGQELESLQTAYLKVNYVKARDLATLLRGGGTTSAAGASAAGQVMQTGGIADSAGQRVGLLSSRGSVMVNDATNTLIVRDISDGIGNARELVKRLDVQTPQVAIQGLIFEADTDMARDLGIRWGASYVASPETGNPTGQNFPGRIAVGGAGPRDVVDGDDDPANQGRVPVLIDFPANTVTAGAGSTLGLLLGSLDGSTNIDAQITAIERAGKGKVISRPKVITLNNAEAQIQSLEILRVRLPSTGTVINTGAGGSAGSQTVATQAIDTGIILRVTPQVSSDGYILLQMFVKSSVPSTTTTDDIPNEISRQATSQVLVRDGETVVIGGVYRQQATIAEGGVPWIRSVPVFGWFFKNRSSEDRRQELLVFITPRIVWRNTAGARLPNAKELWQERDKSAYDILTPDGENGGGEPSDLSSIPG